MKLWATRNKGGDIRLWTMKPVKTRHSMKQECDSWSSWGGYIELPLTDAELEKKFKDLTWDNSPQEISLSIRILK